MKELTEAAEDYLKSIYLLQCEGERPTTSALAEALGVKPSSVSNMLNKFQKYHSTLVDYTSHHGITLTPQGEAMAKRIIRRHRLIELFLCETLNVHWGDVHKEAEKLEHHLSELLEDKIDSFLGAPTVDPHGEPIPAADGTLPELSYTSLAAMEPGERGTIQRVRNQTRELLAYLTDIGISLGTGVEVVAKAPFDGPIHIRISPGGDAQIGRWVARQIDLAVS